MSGAMSGRGWAALVAALAAVLALGAAPAPAQVAPAPIPAPQVASAPVFVPAPIPGPHLETPQQALADDAAEYARAFSVPLDEATRRVQAQGETVALTDALQRRFADRLAGIAIDHQPFRIDVLLTGSQPVPDEVAQAGGMSVPVTFRTGAAATRVQLVAAIKQYQAAIRAALPHPPAMGVDLRTGELVVIVDGNDLDRFGRATLVEEFAAMTGVPVAVRAIDRPAEDLSGPLPAAPRPEPATVDGGALVVGTNPADGRRYGCTTGFVVTDRTRTGIATAAHCPDTLSLVAAGRHEPLSFVGQWGWGFQDVQVNVSDRPLAPLFFANTAKTIARPVTHRLAAASTRAGDFVCHRGERTGYSCATVELVDFAPAGDLCGGACLPTWITVAGPGCKGGDSGAPVFLGTAAIGIVKGGSYRGSDGACAFYFYMSTDYLPDGWSLLEQPLPTVQPLPEAAAPTIEAP